MVSIVDNRSGAFTGRWTQKTGDLVVGKETNGVRPLGLYLQAKMGRMLGKEASEVLLGTPFRMTANYNNDEGLIPAMKDQPGFVPSLRIDLQKAQVVGGQRYATFQIQWGTGMDGKTGGAYCGALVRVEQTFSVGDLRTALIASEGSQSYWRIDP